MDSITIITLNNNKVIIVTKLIRRIIKDDEQNTDFETQTAPLKPSADNKVCKWDCNYDVECG